MSTSNRLGLQTLGSPPIIPQNLPDHWAKEWRLRVVNTKVSYDQGAVYPQKTNKYFIYLFI